MGKEVLGLLSDIFPNGDLAGLGFCVLVCPGLSTGSKVWQPFGPDRKCLMSSHPVSVSELGVSL